MPVVRDRGPFWDWVGMDVVVEQLNRIERRLDTIERKATNFWNEERARDMAERDELTNLTSQVEANRDAVASAKTALEGYMARVQDLSTQLEQAIANAGDVSPDIKAAADAIRTNTDALTAAIPTMVQAIQTNT